MKSMTGYGIAETTLSGRRCRVEIRSFNHRFLDIRTRVPRPYLAYEARLYQWLRDRIERGRIELNVYLVEEPLDDENTSSVVLNRPVIEGYIRAARQMKEVYGIAGELDINTLLTLPEVTQAPEQKEAGQEGLDALIMAAEGALRAMEEMKKTEGETISRDLAHRIDCIEDHLRQIEVLSHQLPMRCKEKLEDAIHRLLPAEQVDPHRIAQEVVIYAEKSDINEEIVRLRSHIEQIKQSIANDTLSGKRLEFLLQEMHREITTLGAKAQDTGIVYHVVDVKMELEKIREQAQNLQ